MHTIKGVAEKQNCNNKSKLNQNIRDYNPIKSLRSDYDFNMIILRCDSDIT